MRSLAAFTMALSTASAFTRGCGRSVAGRVAASRTLSAAPSFTADGATTGHPDCPLLPPVQATADGTCNVATFAMA